MKKIGMRTIKTGIAVFLSTLVGYLGLVESPVFTVSACIFSLKNTLKNSWNEALSRILGTLIGGLIGYLCAAFLGCNIITATLGVVFIIHICNELKLHDASAIASVTFISICLGIGNNHPLNYSILKTMDTLVGVVIALIVNFSISRHRYIKKLWNLFDIAYDDCISIINSMVEEMDFSLSYKKLKDRFDYLKKNYDHLLDELPLSVESYNLNILHNRFDRCESLLHHVHGLYLMEKMAHYSDKALNKAIYKYHTYNILKLLSEDKK